MSGANLTIPGLDDVVEIGRGGFGVVYRATEAKLGRDVAIKVLTGALDEEARTHFERERRAMATVSGHPNIVTIYRSGVTSGGAPYLVMEYLPGGSLADRLETEGQMPWEEVAHIGVQMSGALASAHGAGVLHRDVKPANILLTRDGTPKLGDFGIARLDDRPEAKSDLVTASVVHAPPEVISGQTPDQRADTYSLASTLYELVTGSAAFTRPSDESLIPVIARIAHDPVPDVRRHGVPSDFAVVLERAMKKQPKDRYGSAADFGSAIIAAQRSLDVPDTTMDVSGGSFGEQEATLPAKGTIDARREEFRTGPPITKKWLAGAAAVILLAILIGGVAGYLTSRSGSDSQSNSQPLIEFVAQ